MKNIEYTMGIYMGRSPTNTKAKLIQTANDLIWKNSYGSVSVDDICTSSGVNKGSFYYYFPSKVDLAIATMEEAYQSFEPEMEKVFSASVSAAERFERLAAFVYEKQLETYNKYGRVCGCPFASLGSEMAGKEEAIREKVDEIFRRQEQLLTRTIQEMADAGQLPLETDFAAKASEIHTFIMGQVMMARIQNDLTSLKDDVRTGLFRILNIEEQVTIEPPE
ncbi:TetR/AcrR family transcriptional regulator [Sulfuriflexus mobilis]|uniref:TetR/AcrR family transcriptional regulator n=1 Tax=Sulfuriflexus mobilis TaxID=1811807 RepID=UPI0018D564B8|nr:TetR/AcrR family transcriptional regulator [Sulfuriflexus mobilis]